MKYFLRALWILLVGGIILISPVSCKKKSNNEETSGQFIIPPTTKIIKSSDWNTNLISVDSASHIYVFNSAMVSAYNLKTGDVIVSDAGKGCLRKISGISVSGGQATVTTSFAAISDAIEQGEGTFNYHITQDKIKSIKMLDRKCSIRPVTDKSGKSTNFSYELSTYLDDDEKVQISATLTIDPTVSCSYKISGFTVKKLNIEFKVDESVEVTATLTLLDIQWEKEKKLLEIEMTPITVMIGPVPVIITPSIEINAGVNLNINSAVTSGITQNLSYTVGISYDAGRSGNKWTSYTDLTKGFGFNPPTLSATAEAKAYIKPQFNLEIYEVLSPYLFAELYGRIEADLFANPWWSLYAGAGIGAGVKVEIWGYTLIDYETDPPPILYEILIASAQGGSNGPPDAPKDPHPADSERGVSLITPLIWTCTDPDNDPLTFDIYFGTTDPPPLIQSDVTASTYQPPTLDYNTAYYWQIVAKDDHQHTRTGPLWAFATINSGSGMGIPCPGLDSLSYGGIVYHTDQIGPQCWLKENLNIGNMINSSQSQANNSVIEKYCYQNLASNCNIYGGLYTWDELMNYNTYPGTQGICPQGWHVPTDDEWANMEIELGMTRDEAYQTGMRGTDQGTQLKPGGQAGFEALLGGIYNLGFFSDLTYEGYFATSSLPTTSDIWTRLINLNSPKVGRYQTLRQNALSVRCLKTNR